MSGWTLVRGVLARATYVAFGCRQVAFGCIEVAFGCTEVASQPAERRRHESRRERWLFPMESGFRGAQSRVVGTSLRSATGLVVKERRGVVLRGENRSLYLMAPLLGWFRTKLADNPGAKNPCGFWVCHDGTKRRRGTKRGAATLEVWSRGSRVGIELACRG